MRTAWSDRRVETIMGNLLRTGVLLSAAVILVGAYVYLHRNGHVPADYRVFRGEPAGLRDVRGILHDALSGSGSGIIQSGLLLLIATPIARVAFSVIAFLIQRDALYVFVSIVVLAILGFSLSHAYA